MGIPEIKPVDKGEKMNTIKDLHRSMRQFEFEPESKINVNITEVNGKFKVWVQPKDAKVNFRKREIKGIKK